MRLAAIPTIGWERRVPLVEPANAASPKATTVSSPAAAAGAAPVPTARAVAIRVSETSRVRVRRSTAEG
jgi:hypothetical protein